MSLSVSEQAARLDAFFANRDPGDPPPDPAALGDGADYTLPGAAEAVAAALAGDPADPDCIDAAYSKLQPEAIAAMAQGQVTPGNTLTQELKTRWHVLGIGDLLKPPKRPEYLISDMVRCPGLVCVYGAPGDLKSMILMDLAVCVAGGLPWLEPLPNLGKGGTYRVKPGPILWLDMDNGQDRLQERFGALCRSRGLDLAPLHAISLPRPVYDASDPHEAELLAAQIRDLGAVTCFVDNLGTVSGGQDENSSQMVDVMANLRWVAQDTGATVWVIHHARKGGAPQNGGREGDRLRGHSSIEASLDLALLVERLEDDITIRSTKTRDDPVAPFTARWAFDKTPDGALDQARFWHIETVPQPLPVYAQVAMDLPELLKELSKTPNQSELVKEMGGAFQMKRDTALKAIRYAVTHGWIREQAGATKTSPKLYHVA